MEEKSRIESVFSHINNYLEARWKLLILNTSDKASDLISSLASVLLITLTMIFVLFFLSVSVALMIGRSYGDYSTGFFYVGLFYLVISIILFIFRKTFIKIPVINKFLSAIYTDEKN